MPFGNLYTMPDIPRTIAVLVAAQTSNLDVAIIDTHPYRDIDFVGSSEYRKLNYQGKIPTFVGADGFCLTEVIAIAIYFVSQNEDTDLLGKDKKEYATILRWLSFANSELLPPFGFWFRSLLGQRHYTKEVVDTNSKIALKTIGALETHLSFNTYLVSEQITLADLFTAALLTRPFATVLDRQWRDQNPAVTKWYQTIISLPEFKTILPNPPFIEKGMQYSL